MARTAVVIPWAPGCEHRRAALSYVLRRWEEAALPVVLGRTVADPWCKADAVADALRRTVADVLVVADADVWTDGVFEAIRRVERGAAWAIPHGNVHRLTLGATRSVLEGAPLTRTLPTDESPYRGFEGGGMVVLPRGLYDSSPLDFRFQGWGQEDEAWALALRTLAGYPWRGNAPMFHLWHPPQPRMSRRFGSDESRALYMRYRSAAGFESRMRSVLEGARREVQHGTRHDARPEGEPSSAERAGPHGDLPYAR